MTQLILNNHYSSCSIWQETDDPFHKEEEVQNSFAPFAVTILDMVFFKRRFTKRNNQCSLRCS